MFKVESYVRNFILSFHLEEINVFLIIIFIILGRAGSRPERPAEPGGRPSEPTGKASAPAGRASKPAEGPLEPDVSP